MNKKTKKLVYVSLLSTMAIALHMFEASLAIPLPYGVKLGFANIVSLVTIELFSTKEMFIVNILRVVLGGLLRGSIFNYVWFISVGGVLLSSIAIMLAKKLTDLPIVSISIISAIFHGIGQIIVVVYIYQSILMASFIVLLFVTSIPTGIFTGLSAIAVIKHLKKYTVKLK
ncbi:MAG: Gx transporter family protein [Erysipelotrichaceae bacterium]|nr:Gx transporter family protein [Erysipelotrichaceae bacterium]